MNKTTIIMIATMMLLSSVAFAQAIPSTQLMNDVDVSSQRHPIQPFNIDEDANNYWGANTTDAFLIMNGLNVLNIRNPFIPYWDFKGAALENIYQVYVTEGHFGTIVISDSNVWSTSINGLWLGGQYGTYIVDNGVEYYHADDNLNTFYKPIVAPSVNTGVAIFITDDTTPSINMVEAQIYETANTHDTTITRFDDVQAGTTFTLFCADEHTTIQDNKHIRIGGNDYHCTGQDLCTFYVRTDGFSYGMCYST